MTNLVRKAQIFATASHAAAGCVRKYTGEPYIVHPAAVVSIVTAYVPAEHPRWEEIMAAAWLHDVVEDTAVTIDLIRAEFGETVADLVAALTDDPKSAGNRAFRKERARQRLAGASREAQTIKLADILDNTQTIVEHDPKFARTYLSEIASLLDVMTCGEITLDRAVRHEIEKAAQRLNSGLTTL